MPRFKVIEERMFEETWIADAESESDIRSGNYDLIESEGVTDSYGYAIKDIEEVTEDYAL